MTKKQTVGRRVRFRRPEYTGSNRCLPCTVVNVALAAIGTGAVALVSVPAAVGVAVVALTVIYFRGYLVPGTPQLTRRYLPDWMLGVFGKAGTVERLSASDVDPGVVLVATGAVADSPVTDDVSLDPGFAARLHEQTVALRHGDEDTRRQAIATELDVPFEEVNVVPFGSGCSVFLRDELLGTWESPAALDTDLAAMDLLAARGGTWDRLDVSARSEVVGALRLFVETCPDCGGAIALGERTVESCCSSREVVATTCQDCGSRMLELNVGVDELVAGADGHNIGFSETSQ